MGWMRGYEFKKINESINNSLKLSKEIKIISFRYNRDIDISNNLIIGIYENNKIIEKLNIDPRNIKINSNYLTNKDKEKLNNYLVLTGLHYLDYQLYKIDYTELLNRIRIFY